VLKALIVRILSLIMNQISILFLYTRV